MRSGLNLTTAMTRRGLIVGAVGVGAAVSIRWRAEAVRPSPLSEERDFPDRSFLISPAELRDLIANETPNLLDASVLRNHRERHIPGARHVWWQDIMERNDEFFGTVLKPDDDQSQGRRQSLLQRWHLASDVPTIVYDDSNGERASRVVWFLRFLGIEARLLDGGYRSWLAAGGDYGSSGPNSPDGAIATASPRQGFYLNVVQTANRIGQPGVRIVDLREVDEAREGESRGFSIPGAARFPRSLFLEGGGRLREPASLLALIEQEAVDLGDHLILIAPTGLEACLAWIGFRAMGAPLVTICDGGWQEWVTKPGVPLESVANIRP
jgi:thiosulfate/3-mercaptopyruvate sulfurtransferase